jgi:hypothetical protein
MFLAYLNASFKVDAYIDEVQACMNYLHELCKLA